MNHTKKIKWVVGSCIALVGICSAVILYRTLRLERGLPYERISMEQAAEYMEYEQGYALVDARTREEYAEGHIPGAVCIPNEEIEELAPKLLPDCEQMIYVYCRSGKRSRQAAAALCRMGYSNVTEIGGIRNWPGGTEKE